MKWQQGNRIERGRSWTVTDDHDGQWEVHILFEGKRLPLTVSQAAWVARVNDQEVVPERGYWSTLEQARRAAEAYISNRNDKG
ncbi:MAG TPA: hypothetical protein VF221_18820 [Chloroflexota bacterium]